MQARRELDGVTRPQRMASKERKGGLGNLGGELDQSDRSDVDPKSGQRSIQIVPGESSFSTAASQCGCNLDL